MLRKLTAAIATATLLSPLGCGGGPPAPRGPAPTAAAPAAAPAAPAAHPAHAAASAAVPPTAAAAKRPTPKPLSAAVTRGLRWLASAQLQSGGWGQGDEAVSLRANEPRLGVANVADTSMALLAFLRAGHSPAEGELRHVVDRGLGYVMSEIEASDADSLAVTATRGTRVQAKIGAYVDTFAALMVLTEAKGRMRDPASNARLDAALKKVVRKVERNQRENGSWDDQGWAPVLTQALAAKGMNRAAQAGATVSKSVLDRIEKQASSGDMRTQGSAGIKLYGEASTSANLRDDAETKKARAKALRERGKRPAPMAQSPDVPSRAEIAAADAEAAKAGAAADANERTLLARLDDPAFIAGFGNNGGEELLSYLLISETLVQRGGEEWARWDAAISRLVSTVQNEDGSWTGHHCITGRTFCTAAALLVLLGDRTPPTKTLIAK
jgi:hypothetical protein